MDPYWTLMDAYWTLMDPYGPLLDPYWTLIGPLWTLMDPYWTLMHLKQFTHIHKHLPFCFRGLEHSVRIGVCDKLQHLG